MGNTYGLPETFIIDRAGIVKYKHVGPLMKRDQEHIEKLLLRSPIEKYLLILLSFSI